MIKLKCEEFDIKISDEGHPREAMIEVTRRCNYNCLYCFREGLNTDYLLDMKPETYEESISQCREAGINKLSFTGWGEPLIHPRIMKFVKIAKNEGFTVLVNTNGYYLSRYAEELANSNVDEIVVSIDAGEEDPYRLLRIGGDLNQVARGLSKIREYKKRNGAINPIVKIQFTLNKINYEHILSVAKLAKEYKIKDVIISNVIPNTPENEEKLSCVNDNEFLRKINNLRFELVKYTLDTNINFHLPEFLIKTERRCPFMEKDALYITAEGDVAPCIYYAHPWKPILNGVTRDIQPIRFGNIMKEHLLKIWRKDIYVRFRFNVRFSYMPSCLDCELEKTCLITRSNMYDCWGNKPTCSHCPYSRNIVKCPL